MPCELLQIDRLALKVMSAMQGASCVQQIILEIAGDGQITQDEVLQLEQLRSASQSFTVLFPA